ncbi:MAG TPA: hypothetical protein VKB93_06680 [Thermoanaerobaculia bacterium]|nr:hypothetical protein [Thermoanaerobaculia bacterium]
MGSLLIRAIAIAILLPAFAMAAEKAPTFVAMPGRVVAAVLPAALLSDREVQRQIGSGLTTTFVLAAKQRDADRRGGARIEIRFDLWDEVWLVRRIEFDGKEDRQRIASRDALEKWWSAPVRLFTAATQRVALNVTLSALPFSAAEGEDARDWISKSGGVAATEGGSPLMAALIGTTLSAKPIRSWRWQTEIVFR